MQQPELTPFERIQVQMDAVVPIVRAMEAEFGKDAVRRVLAGQHESAIEAAANEPAPPGNLAHTAAAFNTFAQGNALQYDVIASEKGTLNVDVTHCRYSELMASLDASDLGELLICNHDSAFSLRAGVHLTRTQTRMAGSPHCDFRFRLRDEESQ